MTYWRNLVREMYNQAKKINWGINLFYEGKGLNIEFK